MEKFDRIIAELREQRDWMLSRAKELKSGRQRQQEFRDDGWTDVTAELVSDLWLLAAQLDKLIATYEEMNEPRKSLLQ